MIGPFPPEQLAALDQRYASYCTGVDALVQLARRYRAEDGPELAAASLDHALAHAMVEAGVARVVGIAAVALVRLVELEDIAAAACPCLPGAPAHQHLTGGYRPDYSHGTPRAEDQL